MLVVGVDENGLGPLLGPLVVTAVAFEVDTCDRDRLWRAVPPGLRAADSKKVYSRGAMARAELDTRSWLELFGVRSATHAELVEAIGAPLFVALPCGVAEPAHCRPSSLQLPVWSDEPDLAGITAARQRLSTRGVRPVLVRSLLACAGAFNAAISAPGMNKLRLDFEMMMHLLMGIVEETGGELLAICGKVGSTRRYGPWIDGMSSWLWSALDEQPAQSTYRIAGLGTISFVRNAEELHMPVAVASMVGKYLRELAMLQLNTVLDADRQRPVSGYRDSITERFVAETRARRAELDLAEHCFIRAR